jgi:hypothetical protein
VLDCLFEGCGQAFSLLLTSAIRTSSFLPRNLP